MCEITPQFGWIAGTRCVSKPFWSDPGVRLDIAKIVTLTGNRLTPEMLLAFTTFQIKEKMQMSTKRNAHVGFVHDEQALRRQIPHPLIATNVKGAYAIPAPPGDFDSNSASPDDLVKNGIYWRRPAATDDPALVKAWQRFFSRKWLARDRIVPNLEPQIGKTHILRKPFRRVSETNFLNADWAGAGLWGSPPP